MRCLVNCLSAASKSSGNEIRPDGSDLFTGGRPYVPDGLTENEYSKIKQKEIERLKKMNYGAWGPRFKRTGVPDGDWMVMPSLWTNGFNAQPRGAAASRQQRLSVLRAPVLVAARVTALFRKSLPAFLLSFILIDTFTTAMSLYAEANLTTHRTLMILLKIPAMKAQNWISDPVTRIRTTQKLATILLAAPVMSGVLERLNRRRLWSNRRSLATAAALALSVITIWTSMLGIVKS